MVFLKKVKYKTILYSILLLFIHFIAAHAQNESRGVPFITSFSEKDFSVSNQNWDVVQDERDVMYFANDYGVLEYNGTDWNIIQVPLNRSITRSLAFGKNNKLFVGAQDFMGFIDSKNGMLTMQSLGELLPPDERNFSNIWDIYNYGDRMIFFSWKALYLFNGSSFKIIKDKNPFKASFRAGKRIFIQGDDRLYEFKNDSLYILPNTSALSNKEIAFITSFNNDELLIGCVSGEIFSYRSNVLNNITLTDNSLLKNNKLLCGIQLKNNLYLAGTSDKGLFLFDKNGAILQHLTKLNGLGHNHVKQVFEDKNGNWWILNERGIDFIQASSPFYKITVDSENPFSIYTTCVYNKSLYIGSHTGLFKTNWPDFFSYKNSLPQFDKVPGVGDICWKLDTVYNSLYLCNASGLYEIKNEKPELVYGTTGVWTLIRTKRNADIVLAGTYEGLILLKKKNGKLVFEKKLENFTETSRVAEEDKDGNIWVSHGYKGVYKISLTGEGDSITGVKFYNSRKGFPSDLFINVFKINNEIIFGTQNGVYRYDEMNDSIVIHPLYYSIMGNRNHVKYMHTDKRGRIWYIMDEITNILDLHPDGSWSVENVPSKKLSLEYYPGFENIFFFDNGDALFGTKDGLVYFNKQVPFQPESDFNVIITNVATTGSEPFLFFNERLRFFGDTSQIMKVEIPFNRRNLRFDFTACFYENINQIEFSTYLEGYDEEWSEWNSTRFKEYTNLSNGKYAFHVKAKNVYEKESKEMIFRFFLLPPWYKTPLAYVFYFIFLSFLIWLLFKARTAHFEHEKKRIIEEQKEARDIEQIRYHEEKLMADLENKNKELAASAMKIIYKNEKMLEIKKLIEDVSSESKIKIEQRLSSLMQFIERELKDDQWDDFELRFDQANNNFIKKLKEAYPDLSHHDLKICAYLRMNLDTKEIAQILNMSVRGVETARFRIRKRIGLDQAENLSDFILRI